MNLGKSILLWGWIDVLAVLWFVVIDFVAGKVPIYDQVREIISASEGFGLVGGSFLSLASIALFFSIAISGILMVKKKRLGVYLSLIQFPFRLFLVLPPTLFFFPKIFGLFSLPMIALLVVIYFVEVVKVVSQIRWLRAVQ